MKSLGEILQRHMNQMPIAKQVSATMVVEKANETIKTVFGAKAFKYAQAIYFKDKVLAITCLSSVMAQELKLNEKRLISNINQTLGTSSIEKIKYLI